MTRCGQTEFLALFDTFNEDKKNQVAEKVLHLDKVTPTGMEEYLKRARKLLAESAKEVNPFDEFKPEVPTGVYLKPGSVEFDEFEEKGMAEISKMGIVLIAGGLGERLGYSGIKVGLPVTTMPQCWASSLKGGLDDEKEDFQEDDED